MFKLTFFFFGVFYPVMAIHIRILSWALIFILQLWFPPGKSLVNILITMFVIIIHICLFYRHPSGLILYFNDVLMLNSNSMVEKFRKYDPAVNFFFMIYLKKLKTKNAWFFIRNFICIDTWKKLFLHVWIDYLYS